MATDLEQRIDELEQKLQHATTTKPKKAKKKVLLIIILAIVILGLICTGVILFLKPWHNKTPAVAFLPSAIIQRVDFPVYFYKDAIPDGFHLNESSVVYDQGILIFTLTHPIKQQTVSITEQALPAQFKDSATVGDNKVTGAEGSATVSFREGRTVGTLITKDKKTFVNLNSSDSIGTQTAQDLLRYLKLTQ